MRYRVSLWLREIHLLIKIFADVGFFFFFSPMRNGFYAATHEVTWPLADWSRPSDLVFAVLSPFCSLFECFVIFKRAFVNYIFFFFFACGVEFGFRDGSRRRIAR